MYVPNLNQSVYLYVILFHCDNSLSLIYVLTIDSMFYNLNNINNELVVHILEHNIYTHKISALVLVICVYLMQLK